MRREIEGERRKGMGRKNSCYTGRISSRYMVDKRNCLSILISGRVASTPPAKFSRKTKLVYRPRDFKVSPKFSSETESVYRSPDVNFSDWCTGHVR